MTVLGCATASPGLVPVRVLDPRRVALDLGSAYVAPVPATDLSIAGTSGASRTDVFRAAMAYGPTPPGVASYTSVRVGIGLRSETSLALVGAMGRLGIRTELLGHDENETWMLTGSAAVRAGIPGLTGTGVFPGMDVMSAQSYGGEVGLALGTTRRRIYDIWFRARVGYLHGDSTLDVALVDSQPFGLSTDRIEAGGAVGVHIGFVHVGVSLELEGLYTWVTGAGAGYSASLSGFALVPAGAVDYMF